ncbi:unnamed protein product [Debaryomyces fabryi]|nr:unnamed protein product [Debaryomyces fabryi]
MDITHANIYSSTQSRSRSKSRTRNSTANSRSTSSSRRPTFGRKRSLSSSSTSKLTITPTALDDERLIPTVQATLDNSVPLDFFKQDIIAMVKALRISKWHKRQLTISNMSVNRISGALTNSIYKVEYRDEQQNFVLPTLLLRVYGKNLDSIIDRERELSVLVKLSQRNIGPKLLGIFSNGRFEQFLDGFSPLNKDNLRDEIISQMLGRRMKDLHYKVELSHEDVNGLPMCWKLIYKWIQIFEDTVLPSYEASGIKEEDIFLMKFDKFKDLIKKYEKWLLDHYDTELLASNYKFCHNDTQYGNLLLHESFDVNDIIISHPPSSANLLSDEKSLVIKSTSNKKDHSLAVIDFEYSGPNFVAFDLANHFSEWMADYHDPELSYYIHEDKYPSRLEQLNLIKSYIEYDFQYPSSNLKHTFDKDITQVNAADLIQFEIKKLYNECILWRPAVQIYWCLWGLIQNGPVRPTLANPHHSSSEKVIDSTYSITVGVDKLRLEENAVRDEGDEDEITSSDDDFDYLKYSQQKSGLTIGDLLQFDLVTKNDIPKGHIKDIKYLKCDFFDLNS